MLPLSQRHCSLISEVLGARHGDLGLTDSCVEPDCRVESAQWAGWAGTVGFGLT